MARTNGGLIGTSLVPSISAGGDTVTSFTADGNVTLESGTRLVDYIVVAGGGGGGGGYVAAVAQEVLEVDQVSLFLEALLLLLS